MENEGKIKVKIIHGFSIRCFYTPMINNEINKIQLKLGSTMVHFIRPWV